MLSASLGSVELETLTQRNYFLRQGMACDGLCELAIWNQSCVLHYEVEVKKRILLVYGEEVVARH